MLATTSIPSQRGRCITLNRASQDMESHAVLPVWEAAKDLGGLCPQSWEIESCCQVGTVDLWRLVTNSVGPPGVGAEGVVFS